LDRVLIEEIFADEEATVIQKQPISFSQQKDEIIWRSTATGDFSIPSAYYLEKEMKDAI
jgi:hypothetical protein